MRDLVRQHILSGIHPILLESPRPTGGYQAAKAQGGMLSELIQDNAQFVQRQEDPLFVQNIENILIAEQDEFEDGEGNDWDGRNIN